MKGDGGSDVPDDQALVGRAMSIVHKLDEAVRANTTLGRLHRRESATTKWFTQEWVRPLVAHLRGKNDQALLNAAVRIAASRAHGSNNDVNFVTAGILYEAGADRMLD